MKKDFSKSWKSSRQPRKQRKYIYNAPLSVLGRLMHSTLSKELRKKYSKRSIRVRKGDKVRILRGKFRKKEGKVNKVDLKKHAVYVDGIEITKKDGSKRFVGIHPSNLMIIELVDDKRRIKLSDAGKQDKARPKQAKKDSAAPAKETKAIEDKQENKEKKDEKKDAKNKETKNSTKSNDNKNNNKNQNKVN